MAGLTGEVSRQSHSATFPPDRFYCLLDELPLHLVPPVAWAAQRNQSNGCDLFLNRVGQSHRLGPGQGRLADAVLARAAIRVTYQGAAAG